MAKYYESDYARNKDSKNIVYSFADGVRVEVSLEQYLKDNPNKTEQNFWELKAVSDESHLNIQRNDNKHSNKKISMADESLLNTSTEISLEDSFILSENKKAAIKAAYELLEDKGLTDKQKRRFINFYFGGMKKREIARLEKVHLKSIQECLERAEVKLTNIFNKF